MKLWVLMYIVSVSLVAAKSPPIDVPPTVEKIVAPAPVVKAKFVARGGTCSKNGLLVCDYGMLCQTRMVYTCQPAKLKRKIGMLKGPCKPDKICDEGLSCATEKSKDGTEKYICLKTPMQGQACKEKNRTTPCAKGYECIVKGSDTEGASYCNAEEYNSISGQRGPCGENSKAECGPGLECVDDGQGKTKSCKQISLKYAEDNKLPKEGEKCKGEYGKEGVCATGLVCTPDPQDQKDVRDGVCQRLGLQGDICESPGRPSLPCAEGYNCVDRGPGFTLSTKFCIKKDHKFMMYNNFDGCGPETQAFCAPGLECIESKVKYPKTMICLRKGDSEEPIPKSADKDNAKPKIITFADDVVPGREVKPAVFKSTAILNSKEDAEEKPLHIDVKEVLKLAEKKPEPVMGDDKKPMGKKEETKPEEKKVEENKSEPKPADKKIAETGSYVITELL